MNFPSLLADLKSWGHSGTDVAAYCQCAKSTISEISSGKIESPGYEIGAKIVALHDKAKRANYRKHPRQVADLAAARKASTAAQAKTKQINHTKGTK